MAQRLDKWLVYARFVKHRARASELISQGQVRINRERIDKPSQAVKPMDILTLAIAGRVRVIRVLGEAERRESAPSASLLYEELAPRAKADGSSAEF